MFVVILIVEFVYLWVFLLICCLCVCVYESVFLVFFLMYCDVRMLKCGFMSIFFWLSFRGCFFLDRVSCFLKLILFLIFIVLVYFLSSKVVIGKGVILCCMKRCFFFLCFMVILKMNCFCDLFLMVCVLMIRMFDGFLILL